MAGNEVIHRAYPQSYLINALYIYRYHPKEGIIYLKDGTEIPVSSRKKEMVDKYFKNL